MPNVGKSTLFNALTKQQALAANYPFATIDPNVGIVAVPDERLNRLSKIEKSQKIVPTTVEFVDIAGLVKDAHKGEGLGNKFLSHIREVDAIAEVVRFFADDNVHHVEGSVDGARDIETIKTELILADLETIEKRLVKLESEARGRVAEAIKAFEAVKKISAELSSGKMVNEIPLTDEEKEFIADLQLLTAKPFLYVANTTSVVPARLDSRQARQAEAETQTPSSSPPYKGGEMITIDAKLESELAELSDEDKKEYLKELGIAESGLDKLIKKAYETLNLITFFTAGEKETRAWTITNGSTAPQAAGKIHTDFERGFIKADTVAYDKFVEAVGWVQARDRGWVRTEGKEYIVADGDVMLFKFNV